MSKRARALPPSQLALTAITITTALTTLTSCGVEESGFTPPPRRPLLPAWDRGPPRRALPVPQQLSL